MLKYVLGVLVLLAVLSFAYYAISPLFRNISIDETLPGTPTAEQSANTDEETGQETQATPPRAVTGTIGHPASGSVRIVEADGKKYLRYENFKTINGPDLFVYLAKDKDAKDFINLGAVKATEGNINYEIPEGVDPRDYPYALTWCRAFGVLFNSAQLY